MGNGEVARVVGLWLLLLPSHLVTAVLGVGRGLPGSFLGPAASALPLGARLCPLQVAGRLEAVICFPFEDGLPALGQEGVRSSRPPAPAPAPTRSDAGEALSQAELVTTSGRAEVLVFRLPPWGGRHRPERGVTGQESSLT